MTETLCSSFRVMRDYRLANLRLVVRKPVFGVSDQIRHKPGCTATEDGSKPEISHLESRGIVVSM